MFSKVIYKYVMQCLMRTYCLMNWMASSYFIPLSISAKATRTGALQQRNSSQKAWRTANEPQNNSWKKNLSRSPIVLEDRYNLVNIKSRIFSLTALSLIKQMDRIYHANNTFCFKIKLNLAVNESKILVTKML